MKKTAPLFVIAAVLLAAACSTAPRAAKPQPVAKSAIVDILSFNDFHGSLAEDPKGKNPGIAKLVAYAKAQIAAQPNTIIVSGGDLYQGSALSNLTYGKPVNEILKLLNVRLSALGNHEFDWGADRIAGWQRDSGMTFLASNVYDRTTGKPVAWAKPYAFQTVGGHSIAFIGLATMETAYKVKADAIKDIEFRDPAKSAETWIDFLDAGNAPEGRPELIVALTHLPSQQGKNPGVVEGMKELDELDALCKVPGLAAVITAHSHNLVSGLDNGIPVVQASYDGRALARLSIAFKDDGSCSITPSVLEFYKTKDRITPDAQTVAIYNRYNDQLKPILGETLATATAEITHNAATENLTPLGKLVCDMLQKAAGTQVVIMNGGGLRRGLAAGPVTVGDLYELMPFDNTMVTCELSGADLKKAIDHGIDSSDIERGQFTGLVVTWDPNAAYGSKVVSMTLPDGTPIADDKYYTVATNDFQFSGGDKYTVFSKARKARDSYIPIRDLLTKGFKDAGTVSPPAVDSLKAVQ
jgi:2',3'-cyclic-nucleotide 2'-phosphodiesterase (5'-nucleotidase family)